jgi:predicted MFS family arabinose efflux permease
LFSPDAGRANLPRMKAQLRSPLALVALAYIPDVLSMMTVGVVVPFIAVLSRDLAATPAQLGLAIALFSMPTAILATLGGGLIDRYGIRSSMLFAGACSAVASALGSITQSLLAFDCALVLAGLGFGGICVAAPSLLIHTLSDGPRIRAMSFLSTFAPTGYAAGLLLAVPFADSGDWRTALRLHAALMAIMVLAMALYLPRINASGESTRRRQSLGEMLAILREPRALRLGIAVALPNALSYGTSLAAPSYLARVHEISLATSSATVAIAKIVAMIVGGLSMGYLLSRAVSTTLLFAIMAAIGAVAQIVLFLPASGITIATAGLILWLFAFGGMSGGAMTLLPGVARDPARSGAASGLINQCISAASFAAPPTWLALQEGAQFMGLAVMCLLVSLIALPRPAASTTIQRPAPL